MKVMMKVKVVALLSFSLFWEKPVFRVSEENIFPLLENVYLGGIGENISPPPRTELPHH